MSLKYILDRVQKDAGYSVDINPEQRTYLIDKINEAADEIYSSKDLPVVLKEVYLKVLNDKTIALPTFVGEIRALRSRIWDDKWSLQDVRARYATVDWDTKIDRVRIIGERPIQTELLDTSHLYCVYKVADPDLKVTIVGETDDSNRAVDTITMTSATMEGTANFTDITAIRKNKITDYNVTITDGEGNELAIIYADQLEARYVVVDVSKYPMIQDCCDGSGFIMEVLYKPRLNKMLNDEDSFPLLDYDDIIILTTKQLLAEEQEGKEQRALLMHQKSKEKLENKIQDKTGTVQHRLSVTPNPLFGLFDGRYR